MSTAAANALPVLDLHGFEAGRSERATFLEQLRNTVPISERVHHGADDRVIARPDIELTLILSPATDDLPVLGLANV